LHGKVSLPLLIGGDFNIIRNPSEKNNDKFDNRWPFLFNAIIDGLDLREIEMSGRKFTWANSKSVPTYEKLDRVLASTEWEQKFPLVTVDALNREISDHTPLLLSTGEKACVGSQPEFKFELSWFLQKDFFETVARIWNSVDYGSTPMKKWQNKIRRLRQYLRGWAKNVNGNFRREKDELFRLAGELDLKVESQILSQQEIDLKQSLKERIAQLLREEEIKWLQRVKTKDLLEGDNNTKYFHIVANGKRRKTRIFQLEQEGKVIEGQENLKVFITKYYKDLFGSSQRNNFSLDESQTDDLPQINEEENKILVDEFTEKEVREAIFQMKHNKVPGPDGFPAEFF
jgi:mannosylglycoprotein endo-beta-mannosidase